MKKFNKLIGNVGEEICLNFLMSKNYKILYKNFRCRQGEIDLICIDRDVLVFIEVKSRFFTSYGFPRESVNYTKINKIIKVANYFIYKNNFTNYNARFDVIEVLFTSLREVNSINHLENAFQI